MKVREKVIYQIVIVILALSTLFFLFTDITQNRVENKSMTHQLRGRIYTNDCETMISFTNDYDFRSAFSANVTLELYAPVKNKSDVDTTTLWKHSNKWKQDINADNLYRSDQKSADILLPDYILDEYEDHYLPVKLETHRYEHGDWIKVDSLFFIPL